MAESIFDRIEKEGHHPFTLALLFNSAPYQLAGLLSDSALEKIESAKEKALGELAQQILFSEIASRQGKARRPLRLNQLSEESPYCFPVVFRVEDPSKGLCRCADIQIFCLQSNHQMPVHWPEDFKRSCDEAIVLADTMVPGNDRPWAKPCMPELVHEMGRPSGALSFFFATMCYLLDLPYPNQVICSAQLANGRFAPVTSIAEKAQSALQDGFDYFVVCGEQNRIEAEAATQPPKGERRKLKILTLAEGESPGDQFLDLIAKLTQTDQIWKDIDLNALVDFLLNRALLVARNDPLRGVLQLQRLKRILSCLPKPGLDNISDSLRLDVLGALGSFSSRCRKGAQAKEAFDELQSICNRLLRKRQCPANFEDHWFALPLNRGLLALHSYDYQTAKKQFAKAERERKRRWPPSSRFDGLILQAEGRLHLLQGQTNKNKALAAPEYFKKAEKKLYPADRYANNRFWAESLIQLSRFAAAQRHMKKAQEGSAEDRALALASQIRTLTIEGMVRKDLNTLRQALTLFHAYERQHTNHCAPPWPLIASIYAALATGPVQSRHETLQLLMAIEIEKSNHANGSLWCAPVRLLLNLWIAWLSTTEGDKDQYQKAIKGIVCLSSQLLKTPMEKLIVEPIKALKQTGQDETLLILRTLITRIQYGVPETLFDTFVKNL